MENNSSQLPTSSVCVTGDVVEARNQMENLNRFVQKIPSHNVLTSPRICSCGKTEACFRHNCGYPGWHGA